MTEDDMKRAGLSAMPDLAAPVSEPPEDTSLLEAGNWVPSPNFNKRRVGMKPDLLLLHYTATPTNDYALHLLTSPEAGVSSHYLIDGMGRIIQMVREADRAWHAGEALWDGEADINSCSIGIEIQNQGYALERVPSYGKAQMAAVVALSKDIVERHGIKASRVLGHSDVAPHRKQDPGAHFNWRFLFEAGVGRFPQLDELSIFELRAVPLVLQTSLIEEMQEKLRLIGYGVEITGELDERTILVLMAFQRHYRPALVDGVPDRETFKLIGMLCNSD